MEDMDRDQNGEITLEEYMDHINDMSSDEEKSDPNFAQVWHNSYKALYN